jgi:AcrR family transcriptional regulator
MAQPDSAPSPRRSRLAAADRRASIVAAAGELFAEIGYQRCRVSDVAARLGVTEPVVFQNFGSKAGLYAAVLNDAADKLVVELRAFLDDDGASAVAVLGEIMAPGHIERMHAHGSPGALFADAVALTTEPGIEEAARRGMRRVADALVDLVRRGQAQGEISADVDPPAAAWGLLSLIASHRFRNVVIPSRKRRSLESGLITLYLDALRKPPLEAPST